MNIRDERGSSFERIIKRTRRSIWFKFRRTSRLHLVILFTLLASLYFFLNRSTSLKKKSKTTTLGNQPTYEQNSTTCFATLCNPSNKCSTWLPNRPYDWSELSQAGIFRDLATIQVEFGCELKIKLESERSEWMTLPTGKKINCEGYDTKCGNLVAIDLKANILILATQLNQKMQDPSTEGQEIVMVHHGQESSNRNVDVSLISQFSVNRLEPFVEVIESWQGPISVAIHLTQSTDIDTLVQFLKTSKNLDLYSRLTITLIKPNYLDPKHLAYPINHLRNIAITQSTTEYIFVTDADFVPSNNLYTFIRSRLIPYVIYQSGKIPPTAWVVPCFAIREAYAQLPIPNTYNELRRLVGQNVAYITDPGAGHGPTLAVEIAMVRPLLMGNPLAYEVCYESQWEPYYVLHRSAPLYDVRFRNQGGDKQSHALHLNAEKYRFMVLREVFMVHRDHSKMVWPSGGFEKSQKEVKTWNYFNEFMNEIQSIYGRNSRWPRGCSAIAIGWQDQRRDVVGLAAGAV
ncbi:Glycosyltransferase-like 1B [Rhizopus azygosporus]|uniref:Glycosyltransferase-like 1B n=1 Tax=Rhizopus azygosporus TaxID=86630 RepID=A0A367JQT9_RHIAZ|nr:Glycosyltransferase-like 1B [Rhizopus azygosporus]